MHAYVILQESTDFFSEIVYPLNCKSTEKKPKCFYPFEIILSHIPVPTRGKDKNEQLHVGRTLAVCQSMMSL